MELPHIEWFAKLLQLSVIPVVLISGVGLLLLSFTNRLARTIDRSRTLIKELRSIPEGEQSATNQQLEILIRRSEYLRAAITFTALSILFSSLMIIGLFFLLFLQWPTEHLVLLFFFIGVLSIIISMGFFLLDIYLSLRALKLEVGRDFPKKD
jgi:ABC-type multidrug transport system fused ATPase/permease subunit